MSQRDEFSLAVRKTIAERSAYFCANPRCYRLTAGPHSEPTKSLKTGHAAHIHAASPKGPRFDPRQTIAERTSIQNAIWLCRDCGDLVDKDTSAYSAEELRRWRSNHEAIIGEVRSKGYAESLQLLQSRAVEPQAVKHLFDIFSDRRVFWETFDAEMPGRVLSSLNRFRDEIVRLRRDLAQGSPVDLILETLGKTVVAFFQRVESLDLMSLKASANNANWIHFCDALLALRKSVGLQLFSLAATYNLRLPEEFEALARTAGPISD